jgi:hypothetical protein
MRASPTLTHVTVNGLAIAVWDWIGPGDPLLFVHATGYHGRCWDAVIAHFPTTAASPSTCAVTDAATSPHRPQIGASWGRTWLLSDERRGRLKYLPGDCPASASRR